MRKPKEQFRACSSNLESLLLSVPESQPWSSLPWATQPAAMCKLTLPVKHLPVTPARRPAPGAPRARPPRTLPPPGSGDGSTLRASFIFSELLGPELLSWKRRFRVMSSQDSSWLRGILRFPRQHWCCSSFTCQTRRSAQRWGWRRNTQGGPEPRLRPPPSTSCRHAQRSRKPPQGDSKHCNKWCYSVATSQGLSSPNHIVTMSTKKRKPRSRNPLQGPWAERQQSTPIWRLEGNVLSPVKTVTIHMPSGAPSSSGDTCSWKRPISKLLLRLLLKMYNICFNCMTISGSWIITFSFVSATGINSC